MNANCGLRMRRVVQRAPILRLGNGEPGASSKFWPPWIRNSGRPR